MLMTTFLVHFYLFFLQARQKIIICDKCEQPSAINFVKIRISECRFHRMNSIKGWLTFYLISQRRILVANHRDVKEKR